jgi:hypothetical protein
MYPNFVNLTPHVINVENEHGAIIAFQPGATPARLATSQETVIKDDFKFSRTIYGAIENLPNPLDGVIYITSMVVAQAANRKDTVKVNPNAKEIKEELTRHWKGK